MDGSNENPIEILLTTLMKEVEVCSNSTKGRKILCFACRECAPENQSVVEKEITDFINKNVVGKIDKNHFFFYFGQFI